MKSFALLATTICLGCSGDDAAVIDAPLDGTTIDTATIDTPNPDPPDAPGPDARPSTVMMVTCPTDMSQLASSVTTPGFNFAITQPLITTGGIVRFQLASFHTATSGTVAGGIGTPDGQFRVPFGGAAVCFQFTAPGDFPFYCEPHLFTGTLGVRDPV